MGLVNRHDEPDVANEVPTKVTGEADPPVPALNPRIAALRRAAGIWANRADIPADGLHYERELRDEWR